jgi:transposase
MARKNQTSYTDEFRQQIVKLVKSGKDAATIHREYGVSKTSIYEWVKKYDNSGSFRQKDNMTEEERELIDLRKENKQLKMEVDILKQAALIMAQR